MTPSPLTVHSPLMLSPWFGPWGLNTYTPGRNVTFAPLLMAMLVYTPGVNDRVSPLCTFTSGCRVQSVMLDTFALPGTGTSRSGSGEIGARAKSGDGWVGACPLITLE